jgi:hypothetical protein
MPLKTLQKTVEKFIWGLRRSLRELVDVEQADMKMLLLLAGNISPLENCGGAVILYTAKTQSSATPAHKVTMKAYLY